MYEDFVIESITGDGNSEEASSSLPNPTFDGE
jgi:hypothetical protein